MQRKRQFRGFSSDLKKWVYGGFCTDGERYMIIHKQGNNLMQHTEVISESVGEYAGITDKNKVEIYEGDILQYTQHSKYSLNSDLFIVKWDEDFACFGYIKKSDVLKNITPFSEHDELSEDVLSYSEVIGNTFENPELIIK